MRNKANMRWFLIVAFMLLVARCATAKSLHLKYGFGALQSSNSQAVMMGYQDQLGGVFAHQFEFGGWVDNNAGRDSGLQYSYSLGVRVVRPDFYVESMHGFGFINSGDKLLSKGFQFNHDVGAGLLDGDGSGIGVGFKHISSAGVGTPNIGRNYFMVKLMMGL